MSIIGQSNAMHNRFAMGGGFMPMARTPMARPMMSGPIFVMGGFEQPSHCHCGEKAALWGGLIGGGLGILAGLFGRKQQAVQYAPGYGGGYGGGGGVVQQPLTSAQQLTNLKTLYGDKGYAIVDNGDGTFSATKGGNNIGRGSYEDMQKLLGESNDKTNNSTTAKDNTGSTEGKGGDPKKVDTTNTTTVNEDDKKDKDKVDDDKKTGDTAKKDSTTKTDDKSKTGETVTTDDDSSTKPTDGGSKAKGSGSAGKTRGTGSASGAKKSGNTQPTTYTSSTGRFAKKGADGKWHYYAKDGTELNENHISKNDPELWAKTNPKYASKKNAIYTTKNGDYATKDDQGRLHYFDQNGKPITEKQFKGTHNTVNTTNVKQGGYSSQKGHRVASKTGRWAEKGQDGKWHYYAKDGTELKGSYIQQKDPELYRKTHTPAPTQQKHTEQADNTRVVRPPHFSNIKRH